MKIKQKIAIETKRLVELALAEDQAKHDRTSRILFSPQHTSQATILFQKPGILCGIEIAQFILKYLDPHCKIQILKPDASFVKANQKILTVEGKTIALLSAERTLLNFLQHLSGIATLSHQFVQAVQGTKAKIFDTRKTTPGLRYLEKYAVRCGGALNHRMDLHSMAMVKDNHLKALGQVAVSPPSPPSPASHPLFLSDKNKRTKMATAITQLKSKLPKGVTLLIETENQKQIELALLAKADIILLDNMTIPQLKKSIHFIHQRTHPHPLIEVSGGVTLKNVSKIAKLGVDRISVGALTHSAPALEISMEFKKS